MQGLVRLVSAKIASLMQACRNIEQLRDLLGVEGDFTAIVQQQLASGYIGLWDTKAEDKDRKTL